MAAEVDIIFPSRVMVNIADFAISKDPTSMICTMPLGAGVGVAIYDPEVKVGGVLHSLLPSSSLDEQWAANRPGMFLDTGLQLLLSRVTEMNAVTEHLRIVVAGAAQFIDEPPALNIGQSNLDALGGLLAQLGVKVHVQEVGGRTNCSMELLLATGEVRLKYSGQPRHKTLCKP